MKEQLHQFIRANVNNPDPDEIEAITKIFHVKVLQKGEVFKKADKVCRELGFIVNGSLRHYAVKQNGKEVTGRIAQKNDFATDLISVRTKGVTPVTIKAMETTTLLVASINEVQYLLNTNLTFNRIMREYMAESLVSLAKLHVIFLTGTARERYHFILEQNPDLLKIVPLRFIASMIGITPTQLSRIRNIRER